MQVRALENRLRLVAQKQGLTLVKSRSQDAVKRFGGFMLVDTDGQIVAGGAPVAYSLQVHDVQIFLEGSDPHG